MADDPEMWRLDLPPYAVIDETRWVSHRWAWLEAVTVVADGTEYGRGTIANKVVPVSLPDDYLGPFEVHLLGEDGSRMVAAEGRRLRTLD